MRGCCDRIYCPISRSDPFPKEECENCNSFIPCDECEYKDTCDGNDSYFVM